MVEHRHIKVDMVESLKPTPFSAFNPGTLSARVSIGSLETDGQEMPCLMDGIVVLQAQSATTLDVLAKSDAYQAAIQKTFSSFIGRLERLF